MTWVTNSPQAAAGLREVDAAYEAARLAAIHLSLAEKIVALRLAKITRDEGYKELTTGHLTAVYSPSI